MRHKQTGTILAVKVSQGQSKKAGKGTRYMSLVILPTLFIFNIAEDPRHSEHSGAEKAAHGPRHYHAFVRLLEIPNFQKHRFWNDLHARNPKNEELYSSISMRGHLRDRALSLLRPSLSSSFTLLANPRQLETASPYLSDFDNPFNIHFLF